MRVLRAAGGCLLLILTGVVGLLGAVLSVTIILLPIGLPLLWSAKKLFGFSMALFLPRAVRHPAQELGKKARGGASDAADTVQSSAKTAERDGKRGADLADEAGDKVAQKLGKKDRSLMGRLRRAF
jgi:hypothetical protein